MSLENEIQSLTAAVKALTEALVASRSTITATPAAEAVTMMYSPEVAQQAVEALKPLETPKAEEAPKAEPTPAAALAPEQSKPVTRDELREIAKKKMQPAGGAALVKKTVTDFGVASITACPDDKLVALKAVLEALP